MRTLNTLVLAISLAGLGSAAAAQDQAETPDLDKIYNATDLLGEDPILDSLPVEINCPQYDPRKVRGGADQFSFEQTPTLDRGPQRVEATIEFVVRTDGRIERKQTRVIRSTDRRYDRSLEYWIRTCRFRPGKIGEHAVRVRMQKTWRLRWGNY